MHRINMDRSPKKSTSPQPKSMSVHHPQHILTQPVPYLTEAPAQAAKGISFDLRHIPISRPDSSDASHSSLAQVRQRIQRKPVLGPEDDIYEREADKIALQLLPHFRHTAVSSQDTHSADGGASHALADPSAGRIQGVTGISVSTNPVTDDVESGIQRVQGSGSPLPAAIRSPAEQALRTDLRSVRIHTDASAAHLNRSILAQAFTTGEHIFFAQSAYQPTRTDGQQLLAHELTHVVQQRGGISHYADQHLAADQLPTPLIQRGKEGKKKKTEQRKREREEKAEKLSVPMKGSEPRPSREERERQKRTNKKLEDINAELERMDQQGRTRMSKKNRPALKQEEQKVMTSGAASGAFRKTRPQPPNFREDIRGRRLWQTGKKGAIRPGWGRGRR